MKNTRRRMLPRADINVTPFIDILLVLLVIFMTISPNVPTGLKTNIREQPPPGVQPSEPEKVVVLSMDRNGVIKINQKEVQAPQLIEQLQEIFKTRSDRTIFVQGDEELLFSDMAHLIDLAKGAGIERLGLVTEPITVK